MSPLRDRNVLLALPPRRLALGIIFCVVMVAAAGGESSNLTRLKSMPSEQRAALLETLKKFDALDYHQREKIRKLDQDINSKDEGERARYMSLVRRYHLFYTRLSEEQKKAIDGKLDPSKKLDVALEVAKKLAEDEPRVRPAASLAAFQGFPPQLEAAHLIKIWLAIDPKERVKLDKLLNEPRDLREQISPVGKELGVAWTHKIAKEDNSWADEQLKNATPPKNQNVDPNRLHMFLAQSHYVSRYPYQGSLDPELLMRFCLALPRLYRGHLDVLGPERARQRLAVLFALVDAKPEDFPPPANSKSKKTEKRSGEASGSPF